MKESIIAQQILQQKYDKDLLCEFYKSFESNGSIYPLEEAKTKSFIKLANKKIDLLKQFKTVPEELKSHIESVIQDISTDSNCFNKEDAISSLIGSIGHYETYEE